MGKLNFLQILFHFIATYCCIFLFRTLSWIYNIRILEITEKYGVKNVIKDFNHYGIQATDIWNVTAFPSIATLIGMLFATIISIILTIKRKWSLINCLVVFIICFAVNYFNLPIFDYLKKFNTIRFIDNLLIQLIFTCVIFFVMGIFLFFSKNTKNLIEKNTER